MLIARDEIKAVKLRKCLLTSVAEFERFLASLPHAEVNIRIDTLRQRTVAELIAYPEHH